MIKPRKPIDLLNWLNSCAEKVLLLFSSIFRKNNLLIRLNRKTFSKIQKLHEPQIETLQKPQKLIYF